MFLQAFNTNRKGRDYVIGDLHGMYDLLFQALDKVDFNPETDRCFSVGDLIDRGPDSEKCLSLIHESWFHPVRGNHENTLVEVARTPSSAVLADWVLNGGRWHLQVTSKKMLTYANWIDTLPYLITVELANDQTVAICHAEYPLQHWNPEKIEQDPELTRQLQWSRRKVQERDDSKTLGVDHIVCGHTIVEKPLTLGNTYFIDTGAFCSNILTLQPLSELG